MKLVGTKQMIGVGLIFALLIIFSYINYLVSLRKERDFQRKLDIATIAKGVESYALDYGSYPLSSDDGKIIACKGADTDYLRNEKGDVVKYSSNKAPLVNLVPCNWGKDSLRDVLDVNYPNYISTIPKDPHQEMGASYVYFSDGEGYYVFGSYEGKSEIEYSSEVKDLNVACGVRICNFVKFSLNTTLENFKNKYENGIRK
jgi:hypothetical protein